MFIKTRVVGLKLRLWNFLFAPLCSIRDCGNLAMHSAHIHRISGDFSAGSFLAICGNESCLERVKEVEKTTNVTLAPLDTLISMGRQSGRHVGVLRRIVA